MIVKMGSMHQLKELQHVQAVQLDVMEIVLKQQDCVQVVLVDMDIQVENVQNVQQEHMHRKDRHLIVSHVLKEVFQEKEHQVVQNVQMENMQKQQKAQVVQLVQINVMEIVRKQRENVKHVLEGMG